MLFSDMFNCPFLEGRGGGGGGGAKEAYKLYRLPIFKRFR